MTTSTCRHCDRTIITDDDGAWVDPEASGDDAMWRETCDANDTFTAKHEPLRRVRLVLEVDAIIDDPDWTEDDLLANAIHYFESIIDRAEHDTNVKRALEGEARSYTLVTDDAVLFTADDYVAELGDAAGLADVSALPPRERRDLAWAVHHAKATT